MPEPRRTFGPVVLLAGLAAGALATAGTQSWFRPEGEGVVDCEAPCVGLSYGEAGVAWSFGLVMLACLGVVLVSRGRLRRLVCVVGLLAAVGAVVSVVEELVTGRDEVRAAAEQLGATGVDVSIAGWFWVGAVASVVSLVAWLAAIGYVAHWPEMGRRYDAPADTPPDDLWKAMDQGHDPTS